MENYRNLTTDEIARLERNGCTAEDWGTVNVALEFCTEHVRNVAFYGEVNIGRFDKTLETEDGFARHTGIFNATLCDVTISDNCLIENIGNHIRRYVIGEECYISGIGRMTSSTGATFGEGTVIPVLNEAGDGNIIIYKGLTSQTATFMAANAGDAAVWDSLRAMTGKDIEARRSPTGKVGKRVRITNTREIIDTIIGDGCEINGASRLCNCTLAVTDSAAVRIGNDVTCDDTVVSAGSAILGGACLTGCFVGEACHIGKGFSAESCVFFDNAHLDNGEACAAFCGPFTVSHHKSTLLIGGMFSFYNAGSATNYSNHAYKLGPIHHGTLERGSKTASGAHILMPATVGAFSMCMGKIQNHPDTGDMPFSYLIASGNKTFLVPGRNIATVGTFRDTAKWHTRDRRPHDGRKSFVNFDWLSPYTLQKALEGRKTLERLRGTQGEDAAEYTHGRCTIRNGALKNGMRLYDMAIRMFFGEAAEMHDGARSTDSGGTGEWTDLGGMLVPKAEAERLADDIRRGVISSIGDVEERMRDMNDRYDEWSWNWTCNAIREYYATDEMTEDVMRRIKEDGKEAWAAWRAAIADDARKEAALGDMEEGVLEDFLAKL